LLSAPDLERRRHLVDDAARDVARVGRPGDRATDDDVVDARIAWAGVTTRFWSPISAPAGRMPGVTISRSGPTISRTCGASAAEQTMPSMPIAFAAAARTATRSATVSA
jgi:hypothetical protein